MFANADNEQQILIKSKRRKNEIKHTTLHVGAESNGNDAHIAAAWMRNEERIPASTSALKYKSEKAEFFFRHFVDCDYTIHSA